MCVSKAYLCFAYKLIITGTVLMSMGIHAGKADTIDIRNQTVIASPELLKYKKWRLNKTSISKKIKIIYTLYLTISQF